jgi:dihydropteroate synthase
MLDPVSVRQLFEMGLAADVPELRLSLHQQSLELGRRRHLVAVVNLSRDSPYGSSVAHSPAEARRLARIARDDGASIVEFGLESTAPGSSSRSAVEQIELLTPALESCLDLGIEISVETRHSKVIDWAMRFGVRMINLVGYEGYETALEIIARHNAVVILPYTPEAAPALSGYALQGGQPELSRQLDFFRMRVGQARHSGVSQCVIDPGVGFSYAVAEQDRISYQMLQYLQLHRLSGALQVPTLATLVHAPKVFVGPYLRLAEPVMSVLAMMGGVNLIRTHETGSVEMVRQLLDNFSM